MRYLLGDRDASIQIKILAWNSGYFSKIARLLRFRVGYSFEIVAGYFILSRETLSCLRILHICCGKILLLYGSFAVCFVI